MSNSLIITFQSSCNRGTSDRVHTGLVLTQCDTTTSSNPSTNAMTNAQCHFTCPIGSCESFKLNWKPVDDGSFGRRLAKMLQIEMPGPWNVVQAKEHDMYSTRSKQNASRASRGTVSRNDNHHRFSLLLMQRVGSLATCNTAKRFELKTLTILLLFTA